MADDTHDDAVDRAGADSAGAGVTVGGSAVERATQVVAAAGGEGEIVLTAPRFADPLTDAFSVAAAASGHRVREADPGVERDLSPADAVAAASGLLTSPAPQHSPLSGDRRWWGRLWGAAVAPEQRIALLPGSSGTRVVAAVTRDSKVVSRGESPCDSAVVISEPVPPASSWREMFLWSLGPRRRDIWNLVGLALLGGIAGLALPVATAAMFSYAIPSGELSLAIILLGLFALASLAGAVLFFARNLLVIGVRDSADNRMASGIMARLLWLPADFFRGRSQGDVLNRAMSAEEARTTVDDGVPSLVLTSAFGAVNLLFLLAVDVRLALWMTLVILGIVVISVWSQVRARASLGARLETASDADAMLLSLVQSIEPIRSRGAEGRALLTLSALQARALTALNTRLRLKGRGDLGTVFAPPLVSFVLVAVVIGARGRLGADEFMALFAATLQLTLATVAFSANIVTLWELGPVLARALPIAQAPVERPGMRRFPGVLRGEISLTDVVFGYDPEAPPLLDGLSLRIEPGEFVAIVGSSGSGKSTLLRLILGFEQPQSGVVAYDGKDLADLDVTAVRRQLGTVLQSSQPFGTTFRESVAGPLQLSDEQLWAVLEQSGLSEEVGRRDGGLDAPISIGGAALSGGQRQRLMIARALASQPRIVLLDEATSALDNVTQEIVMRSILAMDVTRLAIAHRLSTVERADRVVVMEKGCIVEQGAPGELLRAGGHFAALAARQEL